jgi:peptidoglycan/LPS O-acetylase OafA/YrhL
MLRGIAVMMVVIYHYQFNGVSNSRVGWAGVDLFFVLSGFLISGLLFRELKVTGTLDLKRFLIRRGLKIYPAFYAFLVAMALLTAISWHQHFPWRIFLTAGLFVQNYSHDSALLLKHTWSLAIEEHFYLLLAALFAFLLPKRIHAIPFIWVGLMLGCLALRCLPHSNVVATQCRIDGLFTGVALRYLYEFRQSAFARLARGYALPIAAVCCSPIFFLSVWDSRFMQTVGLSLLTIGFGLIVAWSVDRHPTTSIGKFSAHALAFVGVYSYSIYLWQFIAGFIAAVLPSWMRFPSYLALAIGIGVLTAKLVEFPALRLRDRFFPESTHDRHRTRTEQHSVAPKDAFPRSQELIRVNV